MEKPLVSLCIYTYKQENFVRETLEAAVAQDYPNLEILVSDDCSPDNTFSVIEQFAKEYKGPHKLIINRNDSNMGIAGNVMKLFYMSHGEYIVNNCGDDLSVPDRVSRSVKAIQKEGVESMSFAMSPFGVSVAKTGFFTDEENKTVHYTMNDYLMGHYHSSGASRIMTRKIVDYFGSLNSDCPTEDSTFTLRAFLLGGLSYSYEHLVNYRIHGENTSRGATYFKRINPEPIYRQYITDINTALSKGLIIQTVYDSLKMKFDLYLEQELALRDVFFSGGIFKRAIRLSKYIVSKEINVGTKKTLMRRYLSWIKHNI